METHDQDCPGCQYERRREINSVGIRLSDYKTECSQCGAEIIGEFEHRIAGRNYCPQCLTVDLLTVNCGKCNQPIDWDAKHSDTSGGNGYTVACECGHVQEYSHTQISHKHFSRPTH